jgi:hypothetical protein
MTKNKLDIIKKVNWFSDTSPSMYYSLHVFPPDKLIECLKLIEISRYSAKFKTFSIPRIPKLSGTKGYKRVCIIDDFHFFVKDASIDYFRIADSKELKKLEVTERILEEL